MDPYLKITQNKNNMQKDNYIPQADRKKILLIGDHLFAFSGVGRILKEIVIHTAHHFNWVELAGSIKTPDQGKIFDVSADINKEAGIEDASVKLYPVNEYGSPQILREVMKLEKPDAIMFMSDPRFYLWLYNMEDELRSKIPLVHLNIWDSTPTPMFNSAYYESTDMLLGISKQTVNINKMVLDGVGVPYKEI